MHTKVYLVPSLAKADTGGVSPASPLVSIDEAQMGRGHLQQGVSPHMCILGTPCSPTALVKQGEVYHTNFKYVCILSMFFIVICSWQQHSALCINGFAKVRFCKKLFN